MNIQEEGENEISKVRPENSLVKKRNNPIPYHLLKESLTIYMMKTLTRKYEVK